MNRQSTEVSALEEQQRVMVGDIPTMTFGKTGIQASVISQGGARMDLHPDVQTAAARVRRVFGLGVTCDVLRPRGYRGERSEEAYGIGPQGVRNNVFVTTRTPQHVLSHVVGDFPQRTL